MKKKEFGALPVRQPWAWLIINGHKDIENRRNPPASTKIGKRIAIFATKRKVTREDYEYFLEKIKARKIKRYPKSPDDFDYGAVLGTVFLEGEVVNSKSFWAQRGFSNWKISKARKIKPVKVRGRQFWFNVKI